jgi:hypothetical protein
MITLLHTVISQTFDWKCLHIQNTYQEVSQNCYCAASVVRHICNKTNSSLPKVVNVAENVRKYQRKRCKMFECSNEYVRKYQCKRCGVVRRRWKQLDKCACSTNCAAKSWEKNSKKECAMIFCNIVSCTYSTSQNNNWTQRYWCMNVCICM